MMRLDFEVKRDFGQSTSIAHNHMNELVTCQMLRTKIQGSV